MSTGIWTRTALGDVVDSWVVGSTPPRTNPGYYARKGGEPWAKVEDVRGGVLRRTAEQLSEAGTRQMQPVRENSVLLTTGGTIGRTAIAGKPMYCNQAVQALHFREDRVLPWFGLYFLEYCRPVLVREAGAFIIPHISKRRLQSMKIWYPPIPLQEKIVGHMQLAGTLCESAARLRTLAEQFLRALSVRTAERSGVSACLGYLLEEPPRSGLRGKTSGGSEGTALVSSLAGTKGRLTSLEGCSRVGASPAQVESFSLRPGDVLLRSTAREAAGRGALVGDLPEKALVGGSLVRLRLGRGVSPAWLLTWVLGPGGDRLYADGKLQKKVLEEWELPVIRNPLGFERIFDVYAQLLEKAEQFSQRAQALYDGLLHQVFSDGGAAVFDEEWSGGSQKGAPAGLAQPMGRFLEQMSEFQRELYRTLVLAEGEQPVHALLKGMRGGRLHAGGIQDALSAMALLEQFGFVERESSWKIPVPAPEGIAEAGGEEQYVTDHNGRPIYIDKYKPVEELFEENGYAAGAGENSKL